MCPGGPSALNLLDCKARRYSNNTPPMVIALEGLVKGDRGKEVLRYGGREGGREGGRYREFFRKAQ